MLDERHNMRVRSPSAADVGRAGLAEVMSGLLKHWIPIVAASGLCAVLAYGASQLIPPSYVATATLFIDSRSIQPLAGAAGPPPSGDNNLEVSLIESQARIITSRSVLSRVVAEQGLADAPAVDGTTLADRVRRLLGIAPGEPPNAESRRLKALQALAERITVKRPERTFIVEVSVRADAPETAARLANAVAQAYLDEQATAHAGKARRANDALTSRLDELRDRLHRSQVRVQAFRERHGLVGTRTQLSSEQQLTEANAQLAQARTLLVQSRANLDGLSRAAGDQGSEGTTPEAVASPTVSQLRSKQAEAKRQLDSTLAQFGPRHPAVRDARDQLASIDRSLQAELARIRQAAQRQYQRASASEKASQAIVDRLSGEAANTSSALSELAQLQQEADVNKSLLNTFLSRAREMGEIEQLDTSTARIVSVAEPPLQRVFPPRGIVFLVLGGALGFWLSVATLVLGKMRRLPTGAGPSSRRAEQTGGRGQGLGGPPYQTLQPRNAEPEFPRPSAGIPRSW